MGKERRTTRSTLSTIEEPNPTLLNTTTTYHVHDFQQHQHHQQPRDDDEDPVLFDLAGALERQRRPSALRRLCGMRSVPLTRTNGSLTPFLSALTRTSVREPVETESNLSHLSVFQFVNFAQNSTRCRLTVSLEVPLSQQRSSLNQISDVFFSRVMPKIRNENR